MCSLGRHDQAEDVPAPNAKPPRPRRRHVDGTYGRIVAEMPRAVRKERRVRVHAQLEAELRDQAAPPADHSLEEQFELIPRDQQQLPVRASDQGVPDEKLPWHIRAYG